MKRFIVLTFLTCMLVLTSGCLEGELTTWTTQISNSLDKQQETSLKVLEVVKESNVINIEKMGKLEADVREGFGVVDELQEVALKTAKTYDENLVKGIVVATLESAQVVNEASKGINPYAAIIGTILTAATTIATGFAVKKNGEANVNKTALKEVVVGVEALKTGGFGGDHKSTDIALKEALRSSTSNTTKDMISSIKHNN